MKAAIFNPYLDTLGGGERYALSLAKVLFDAGWSVDIEWRDGGIKKKLEKRFGMKLPGINIAPDIKRGDGYDLCFWVSDGSVPALRSRKNFLHFQVPFKGVGGNSLLNKMKLFRVEKIICNSEFTKKVIDAEYGVESIVVYPPVDIEHIKPKRKENLILSVGRFSQLKQSKKQEILVKAFKKLTATGLTNWKLVLAGGTEVGDGGYTASLEKMSQGFPIEVVKSPDFKTLKELYGKAKIFWSASGFGEDEEKNPEKVEHFGITVVEAMSAGTVPVAYNAGGHREIVRDSDNGFLWNTLGELTKKTKTAIKDRTVLAKKAIESGKKFAYERFEKEILRII